MKIDDGRQTADPGAPSAVDPPPPAATLNSLQELFGLGCHHRAKNRDTTKRKPAPISASTPTKGMGSRTAAAARR